MESLAPFFDSLLTDAMRLHLRLRLTLGRVTLQAVEAPSDGAEGSAHL